MWLEMERARWESRVRDAVCMNNIIEDPLEPEDNGNDKREEWSFKLPAWGYAVLVGLLLLFVLLVYIKWCM